MSNDLLDDLDRVNTVLEPQRCADLMDAARLRIVELEAENARLRKGIEDYRAGDYPNPRRHRPRTCPHGLSYWQECDACNDAALAAILAK